MFNGKTIKPDLATMAREMVVARDKALSLAAALEAEILKTRDDLGQAQARLSSLASTVTISELPMQNLESEFEQQLSVIKA